MHIIRNAGEKKMSSIAGEMINFEVGRRLFTNGAYIPPASGQHTPAYSPIVVDGVRVIIKPTYGFLYIDNHTLGSDELVYGDNNDTKLERWAKLLAKKIQEIQTLVPEAELTKYGRKNQYFPLETGEDGFTSTKMRSKTFDTKFIRIGGKLSNTNLDRAILYCGAWNDVARIQEHFGIARFTWVICQFEQLLHGIAASCAKPDVDKALLSYFTLVYDPNYCIRSIETIQSPNASAAIESVGRELTLKDLSFTREFIPIFSGGIIKLDEIIKNYNADNDDSESQNSSTPVPVAPIVPAAAGTGTVSVMNEPIMNHITMQKMISLLSHIPKEKLRFPAYIPGLDRIPAHMKLTYCSKRLGAVELMKQFGRMRFADLHGITNLPIRAITAQVYDIAYSNVVINNISMPNDVCKKCGTPLYDLIYLTYAASSDRECFAYCQICMHSIFSPYDEIIKTDDIYNATTLYQGCAVLAKTAYPRTYNQVVDKIPDPDVRSIVRNMYMNKNNTMIRVGIDKILFMGCTEESNKAKQLLNSKIYIGVTNLGMFLEYCYGGGYISGDVTAQKFLGSFADTIYQNSVLFPLSITNQSL
jgi:hypothetical protein